MAEAEWTKKKKKKKVRLPSPTKGKMTRKLVGGKLKAKHQKDFLEMYQKLYGNITKTCEAVGVSREAYYKWMKSETPEDMAFKEALDAVEPKEQLLDHAENRLLEKIDNGDTTALIFFLKTKGKIRGYVERQELTGAEGGEMTIKVLKGLDPDKV